MIPAARIIREFAILTGLTIPPAILIGIVGTLFLSCLHWVTITRYHYEWLLFTLPFLGLISVFLYRFSLDSAGGNKLLFGEIRTGKQKIPRAFAPLIFIGTLLTHLGGGSAGREGTALQIGGGIAAGWSYRLGLTQNRARLIILAGAAAGFGAIFGTPIAGAVFAIEVAGLTGLGLGLGLPLAIGAALLADHIAITFGAKHAAYHIASHSGMLDAGALGRLLVAGVAFGLAALFFTRAFRKVTGFFTRTIPNEYLRIVIGAALIILLTILLGTRNYLGLGTYPDPYDTLLFTMGEALSPGDVSPAFWLLKIVFTILTLSVGFKGGEVTPLFIIGACLGNTIAGPLGLPVDLVAGLGLIAVFSGAARAPIAGVFLGLEMFGTEYAPQMILVCLVARAVHRDRGLYAPDPAPLVATELPSAR